MVDLNYNSDITFTLCKKNKKEGSRDYGYPRRLPLVKHSVHKIFITVFSPKTH